MYTKLLLAYIVNALMLHYGQFEFPVPMQAVLFLSWASTNVVHYLRMAMRKDYRTIQFATCYFIGLFIFTHMHI